MEIWGYLKDDLPLIYSCGKGATPKKEPLSLEVPWEQITSWSLKHLNGHWF